MPSKTPDPDFKAAGRAIRDRRRTLGNKTQEWLRQQLVARDVAASAKTISNLEVGISGRSLVPFVEDVLGWEAGSYDEVAAGGQPTLKGGLHISTVTGPDGHAVIPRLPGQDDDSYRKYVEAWQAIIEETRRGFTPSD